MRRERCASSLEVAKASAEAGEEQGDEGAAHEHPVDDVEDEKELARAQLVERVVVVVRSLQFRLGEQVTGCVRSRRLESPDDARDPPADCVTAAGAVEEAAHESRQNIDAERLDKTEHGDNDAWAEHNGEAPCEPVDEIAVDGLEFARLSRCEARSRRVIEGLHVWVFERVDAEEHDEDDFQQATGASNAESAGNFPASHARRFGLYSIHHFRTQKSLLIINQSINQ